MKICLAQILSNKGDFKKNVAKHLDFAQIANEHQCDAIFFPELSISGYEPYQAVKLVCSISNPLFQPFQAFADANNITLAPGFPIKGTDGIEIAMGIFQPNVSPKTYSKNHIHSDETRYFISGKEHHTIRIGSKKITPAICYESLLPIHAEQIRSDQSDLYLASVAKPKSGIQKAEVHYSQIARQYGVFVMMVNSVGPCDNFLSYGKSGVWDSMGKCLTQLDHKREGVLIFDTATLNFEKVYR